jgi:putative membrane protein
LSPRSVSEIPTKTADPGRFELALLLLLLIVTAISCIDPPFPRQIYLQHVPTVAAVAWLAVSRRFWPLSLGSFTLVVAFLLLHVLGARYCYSFVPYDEWCKQLFGFDITSSMGWRRNHYDRLVHWMYGLLVTPAAREIFHRHLHASRRLSLALAVQFILATSLIYELAEWVATFTLAPEQADTYNGQQGDAWDAQKDMAMAMAGSLVAALAILVAEARRRTPPISHRPWENDAADT